MVDAIRFRKNVPHDISWREPLINPDLYDSNWSDETRFQMGAGKRGKFPWVAVLGLPLLLGGPKGFLAYLGLNAAACGSSSGPAEKFAIPQGGDICSYNGDCLPEQTDMICLGGVCAYRPEAIIPDTTNRNDGGQGDGEQDGGRENADPPPAGCKPGNCRPCGPCDLGLEFCDEESQWSRSCEGITQDIMDTPRPCYTGPAETKDVGECRGGTQTCDYNYDGTWDWGICEGQVVPGTETCDEKDNDCDGETDEGLINACGTCGPAPVEICNGVDDNCDGRTDEGLLNACGTCGPAPVEKCNGVDDNCDGRIDEPPACTELDCVVTDIFYFGNDFSSHEYTASPGVQTGISPGDSCGASLGIYFRYVGDWAQISLAVSPQADVVKLSTWSNTGGVALQADGFGCTELSCMTETHCIRTSHQWSMHKLSHNIALDGFINFVFKAFSTELHRTDIAIAEVESCNYVY